MPPARLGARAGAAPSGFFPDEVHLAGVWILAVELDHLVVKRNDDLLDICVGHEPVRPDPLDSAAVGQLHRHDGGNAELARKDAEVGLGSTFDGDEARWPLGKECSREGHRASLREDHRRLEVRLADQLDHVGRLADITHPSPHHPLVKLGNVETCPHRLACHRVLLPARACCWLPL